MAARPALHASGLSRTPQTACTASALALSVYERTRELGLLRAVGTTRGQLRSIVRSESLLISLLGAVEGLVLGMLFGWAIVAASHSAGITHVVIPVVQLLVLAAAAGLAGIMAAIEPSRRAARLDVLRAIYHRVNANREGRPQPRIGRCSTPTAGGRSPRSPISPRSSPSPSADWP